MLRTVAQLREQQPLHQAGRHVRGQPFHRRRLVQRAQGPGLGQGAAGERHLPDEHFVEEQAQGVETAARVERVAAGLSGDR
ncbi:hypothetical protein NB700_001836 [Xanthomonas sacchari]|uniref:Uncharacterized protein n=2 Tax=Xanthomonas sacchari TaxID=56458 RepID=A0ABT3DWC5_9XANT|nr:hypothetical protein [Xanthomonas sacchari]